MTTLTERSLVITETSRRVLLQQGSALSRELKLAARHAQRNRPPILYRMSIIALGTAFLFRNAVGRRLTASFVALALFPALLITGYFTLVASSQYVSEAKFAVRAGERSILDSMASAIGVASLQQAQDTLIIVDYIKSRALVEELDRRVNLRAMFSSPDVDYISRFNPERSIEDLTRYWRSKVRVSIEYTSGLVTVEAFAFTADDALTLAKAVVAVSENLINTMSNRAQQDLLVQSEKELARAENRLRQATASITDLRNRAGLIDPRQRAEAIGKLIDQIRLERLKLEQELTILTKSLVEDSPQVRILRLRIQAANDQINRFESQLTTEKTGDTKAISRSITSFDEAELERQVAEKQYFLVSSNMESARITAERQRLYLSTFVTPMRAHESDYPKRTLFSLLGVAGGLAFWIACLAVWSPIRSRLQARGGL